MTFAKHCAVRPREYGDERDTVLRAQGDRSSSGISHDLSFYLASNYENTEYLHCHIINRIVTYISQFI